MTATVNQACRPLDAGPRYRLVKSLGEGSFGAVYRAQLAGTEQEVAVKALTRVKPEALLRFKREFRALSEVSHPNLVGLRELFEHEGQWFIAMDLVEGTDVLSWVRRIANDNGFDEARLRRAFADMALGLSALHAHGLLHRDLKPSNVRVTPEGKAVVLDFGLVTMTDEGQQSTQRNGVGTLAYMAPEQMGGEKLSAAADLYALGASLYEALTGKQPFEADTPFALMLRKANERPLTPRAIAANVPFELDALCMALLDRAPKQRPSLESVLRLLLGAAGEARSLAPASLRAAGDDGGLPFEGREAELLRLTQGLLRTHEGQLSLLFVEGESGIGKSALVAEFVRRQLAAEPASWVLAGRCYEHERVPYKAFDACMDALARRLSKLAPELCSAVLPRRAALLSELFPVLGGVRAVTERLAQGAPAEPSARRLEAFAVLGELLGKLAESRPLILVIDDLQWADDESLRLLRHLVEERPPPVLVLSTVRPMRELSAAVRKPLEELRKAPSADWLSLFGLPPETIELLARNALGNEVTAGALAQISYESRGHPMLMTELCYHAQVHGAAAQRLTLDAALSARLGRLSAGARRLLEALALCGRPHSEALFGRLSVAHDMGDALKELFAQRFARRASSQTIAVAHDRVRDAVLAGLDATLRTELHHKLALALEQSREAEPSELAEHWDRAGAASQAGALYLEAAKHAHSALAFDSAATQYARAFALLGDDRSAERGALLARCGRALAGAGKSAEAALAFTQAAERVDGVEHVRLRVLAAQHQIQSAQFDEGVRNAREVLEELDIRLPKGTPGALARIAWERGLLKLRGTQVKVRNDLGERERLGLEAMQGLILPLCWADFLPGTALNMVHLRRSLVLGEPGQAARALSQEATFRAMLNEHTTVVGLFALARQAAEQSGLQAAGAFVDFGEGIAALMRSDLESALSKCLAAEAGLLSCGSEDAWLLTNVRMTLCIVRWRAGDYVQFAADFKRWFAEAQAREDVFAINALFGLGLGHHVFLMEDRPQEAQEVLKRSMRPWLGRPAGFAQAGELFAQSAISFYQGGSHARAWLLEQRAAHRRSFFLRRGDSHSVLVGSQILAALAAYADAPTAQRPVLLAEAKAMVNAIEPIGTGAYYRHLLPAQFLALEGAVGAAIEESRRAVEICQQRGDATYRANAEYLQGVLEDGDVGRARCETALAFYRERGWKDPWRAATMFVPAARILEASSPRIRTPTAPLFLGRYRLSESLASSDADELVDALDTRTGRTVTLRSLGRPDPAALGRLKEEWRRFESVHHEHLARSEGLHEHEGRLIVVLERVPKVDFLTFVRPEEQLDEARLRSTLDQALSALSALHEAGTSHGELRAGLLRVSDQGRLLILSRGTLGMRPAEQEEEAEDLDYLAPEQLGSGATSAAADVYALGTSLYQALTGQLPFAHFTVEKIRDAKRRARAVPPWALRLSVPKDLEELCLAMLEREPSLRPSVHEARTRLTDPRAADEAARTARRARALASLVPPPASHVTPMAGAAFVGRAAELARLEARLERAREGTPVLVCVQGAGGIGKTALVNEAIAQLARRTPDARVLRSRCYANEQLRFQAFDGAVDELARALNQLVPAALEALLPPRAALLSQLFPVLASVPMIRGATKKGCPAEPSARRAAAIEALVELLLRLARQSPLVLVIDDLQWADAESFVLLGTLLARAGPGVGIAIVAMLRPGEARDQAVRDALAALLAGPEEVSIPVERLNDDDARTLARRVFGQGPSAAELELAVRESAGHPLFLRELSKLRGGAGSGTGLDLERALLDRVTELAPEARLLLELLALLARPCPLHVLERAAGLQQAFDEGVRALLRSELVERRGPLGLSCFHDRLREAVAGVIPRERARTLCGQLAEALEAEPESDAAERARLWEIAGVTARACAAHGAAGDQALATLTFASAERCYARALELAAVLPEAPLAHWLRQRAHAFVALGKSAEAAPLFEQAAQHASGAEAIRLRVWAAQHQIQSAQFDDGMRNARAVLEELDIAWPQGNASALARIVWERSSLALRGTKVKVRKEIDAWEKLRLDAMAALILPLLWADFLPGTALNMTHLRRALVQGEPSHAARALSQEATLRAMTGDHPACGALYEQAVRLAEQSQLPGAISFVEFGEGIAALLRGELALALAKCSTAEELLTTSCPEEAWLLTNVRMTICTALGRSGHFRQLATSFKQWFAEAQARQDRFAANALFGLGLGYSAFLLEGRAQQALDALEETMRPWRTRPAGFAQAGELFVQTHTRLYLGGTSAYAWLREVQAAHDRSLFLRHGDVHLALVMARANAPLAALAEASGTRRPALLADAKAAARALSASGMGEFVRPVILAQILALEGRSDPALQAAQRAVHVCETRRELTWLQNARYLLGVLEGGEGGKARCEASLTFLREQGCKDPWRFATMYVPAARLLEGKGP